MPEEYRPAIADICEEPKKYWIEVTDGRVNFGFGHTFGKNRLFSGIKYNEFYSADLTKITVSHIYNGHFNKHRKSGDVNEVIFHQAGTEHYMH